LFNIKQKVELLEEKIRKNFFYWLDLCSRKIQKNVTFDGNIIILIEGIEHFKDIETGRESNLKFWLPKVFPDRIKFIITAEKNSSSHHYLKDLGCESICLTLEPKDKNVFEGLLQTFREKKYFCQADHVERVLKIMNDNLCGICSANALFTKTLIATLCPYETPSIIRVNEFDTSVFDTMYDDMDYTSLGELTNIEGLMEFVLEFYSRKMLFGGDRYKIA
jgi:hypothetical protein